ncbi:CHAT domain-containing protein [Tessaracoccus sp. OH4464_COT-324]|uniref:CHAT domain-containing protein n=1 Tax=Tessaracoccus sp. OH4464_COT-324 TaxID=2491059 RepID=UPI000F63CD44|nr:CHAT domain-containing protein [Tessaracoccus sp. OH4464_COT-324]RRD45939.1 CHAT domain-containing protein [Tessaracoccus sp. OH4464_COT-324]
MSSSDEFSRRIWRAWREFDVNRPVPLSNPALDPGRPVVLRARHHILRHPSDGQEQRWFRTPWEIWQHEIKLVENGESAIRAGDLLAARTSFEELRSLADDESAHPMRKVEALIGLGDVLRTEGNGGDARQKYLEAVSLSDRHGLPFGRVRALTPLLHLEGRSLAAKEILERASVAAESAAALGDTVYLANMEMIQAEALVLLNEYDTALVAAKSAEQYFDGNPVGLVGLYIRLSDLFRMREQQGPLRDSLQRLFAMLKNISLPREQVEAHDLKAAWHLMRGELEEAEATANTAETLAKQVNYKEGLNNARITLAQIARKIEDRQKSVEWRTQVIASFRESEYQKAQLAYALIERAELFIDLGEPDQAEADVVEGITALESLRCEQTRPESQAEYRIRFAQVYRRSLEASCRMENSPLFAMAFEGMWGRRLAGLLDEPKHLSEAMLEAQLLAQFQLADDAPPEAGGPRARRLLGSGSAAGGSHLSEEVVRRSAADVAALSRPYDFRSAGEHLADIPHGTAAFLIAPLPERRGKFACLVIDHLGTATCSIFEVPEETAAGIDALNRDGSACTHRLLDWLSHLIPEGVRRLPENVPLLVVPLEELWAIPWPAIPMPDGGGQYLGQRHPVRMCPSLAVAAAARRRTIPEQRTVISWLSPDVDPGFWEREEPARCASAQDMHSVICHGSPTQDALVVAHAIQARELAHVVALAPDVGLFPLEVMSADPPGRVALLTCWSAHVPGESPGDPLTVATVLLARGAATVLATSAELANEPLSGFFTYNIVCNERETDWSRAQQQTMAQLAGAEPFQQKLSCWVPLRVLGAW